MYKKSPSICYVQTKINTTKKSALIAQLKEIPLTAREFDFICDIISGLSIKELAAKHNKTPARISQMKREVCQKIHRFDLANFTH